MSSGNRRGSLMVAEASCSGVEPTKRESASGVFMPLRILPGRRWIKLSVGGLTAVTRPPWPPR